MRVYEGVVSPWAKDKPDPGTIKLIETDNGMTYTLSVRLGGGGRTFKGETAWSDAARYAEDKYGVWFPSL